MDIFTIRVMVTLALLRWKVRKVAQKGEAASFPIRQVPGGGHCPASYKLETGPEEMLLASSAILYKCILAMYKQSPLDH